jgi:hypothetical protein
VQKRRRCGKERNYIKNKAVKRISCEEKNKLPGKKEGVRKEISCK